MFNTVCSSEDGKQHAKLCWQIRYYSWNVVTAGARDVTSEKALTSARALAGVTVEQTRGGAARRAPRHQTSL